MWDGGVCTPPGLTVMWGARDKLGIISDEGGGEEGCTGAGLREGGPMGGCDRCLSCGEPSIGSSLGMFGFSLILTTLEIFLGLAPSVSAIGRLRFITFLLPGESNNVGERAIGGEGVIRSTEDEGCFIRGSIMWPDMGGEVMWLWLVRGGELKAVLRPSKRT